MSRRCCCKQTNSACCGGSCTTCNTCPSVQLKEDGAVLTDVNGAHSLQWVDREDILNVVGSSSLGGFVCCYLVQVPIGFGRVCNMAVGYIVQCDPDSGQFMITRYWYDFNDGTSFTYTCDFAGIKLNGYTSTCGNGQVIKPTGNSLGQSFIRTSTGKFKPSDCSNINFGGVLIQDMPSPFISTPNGNAYTVSTPDPVGGSVGVTMKTADQFSCCSIGGQPCSSCPGKNIGNTGTLTDDNGEHTLTYYPNKGLLCCYTFQTTAMHTNQSGHDGRFCFPVTTDVSISYQVRCDTNNKLQVIRYWLSAECINLAPPQTFNQLAESFCLNDEGQSNSLASANSNTFLLNVTNCDPIEASGDTNGIPSNNFAPDPVNGSVSISIPTQAPIPKKNLHLHLDVTYPIGGGHFETDVYDLTLTYDKHTSWSGILPGLPIPFSLTCNGQLNFSAGSGLGNEPGGLSGPPHEYPGDLTLVSFSDSPFMLVFKYVNGSNTIVYTITE